MSQRLAGKYGFMLVVSVCAVFIRLWIKLSTFVSFGYYHNE